MIYEHGCACEMATKREHKVQNLIHISRKMSTNKKQTNKNSIVNCAVVHELMVNQGIRILTKGKM